MRTSVGSDGSATASRRNSTWRAKAKRQEGRITTNWGRWGSEDEAGALNLLGPGVVRAAAALVRLGQVISLAQPLGPRTIMAPHRQPPARYMTRDAGDYAAGARSPDGFRFAEDIVQFATHSGTHIDALAHVWSGRDLYNGHPAASIRTTSGASRCGADKIRPIVTRGLLLDFVRSGEPLPSGARLGPDELTRVCESAGITPRAGDSVLLRTGWWERHRDNPAYFVEEPGLSDDGAAWLAERDVVAVGADNYGIEVQPSPPGTTFPVHMRLLHRHGILLLENLDLAALGRAEVVEFMFVAPGLPLTGSTAAPVHPVAIF